MAKLINLGRSRLESYKFSVVLLAVIIVISLSSAYCAKTSEKQANQWWSNSIAKAWDKPKTFLTDVIGLSALKFVFMMAVPFIFSIFLGAMLVMMFPFPLLTSTSGLAGAAAIGRRSDSSLDDDLTSGLISYLGLGPSSPQMDINKPPIQTFMQPLSSSSPNFAKLKKRKLKLHKFPVYQKAPTYVPVMTQQFQSKSYGDEDDECYEKLACEIGKSGGKNLKGVVNEIINSLSFPEKHAWHSQIKAYFKGSQFPGTLGMIHNNVSVPYTNVPQFINTNGLYPHQPFYKNQNSCSNYKCTW